MKDETRDALCKALVFGAILYTGYQIAEYSANQRELLTEFNKARELYINASDDLSIELTYLVSEQIA